MLRVFFLAMFSLEYFFIGPFLECSIEIIFMAFLQVSSVSSGSVFMSLFPGSVP